MKKKKKKPQPFNTQGNIRVKLVERQFHGRENNATHLTARIFSHGRGAYRLLPQRATLPPIMFMTWTPRRLDDVTFFSLLSAVVCK